MSILPAVIPTDASVVFDESNNDRPSGPKFCPYCNDLFRTRCRRINSTSGFVIRASRASRFGLRMYGMNADGFDLNFDSETNFPENQHVLNKNTFNDPEKIIKTLNSP